MTAALDRWLEPQRWVRDAAGPCISLGPAGAFDDMHVFAPCVALEGGEFRMWYCGSRDDTAHRVFRLGYATSRDGVVWEKRAEPVCAFGGDVSVLTPTLLRNPDGSVRREDGALRMWFAATDFPKADGLHTLHETMSRDGLSWAPPSPPLLENVYAPTVLHVDGRYRMWYVDVSAEPWCFRHAQSADGRVWKVTPEPVLVLDQEWEYERLFYPVVLGLDGGFVMWYGSYLRGFKTNKTSIGVAVSRDGIRWTKSPRNPVYGPDESRPWESHYTTSESIMVLPDGSLRMWYGSRTKPPFDHKYFAIGTALLPGAVR